MSGPVRVQLRRAKGWRMPENTVKVDRTTNWGNPFIVGEHGTREECVTSHALLCANFIQFSGPSIPEQRLYFAFLRANIWRLRGKNLACWCPIGAPCHADLLLDLARQPKGARRSKIVDAALAKLKSPCSVPFQ